MDIDPDFRPADGDAVSGESEWGWHDAPVPDDVDRVTEVADMMAVFAAQRVLRVEALRRNALDDAARYGGAIESVVDRSVRLELAAALRVTEHAAGDLIGFAEALVHRYPAALDSLGRAGMTERHAEILVDLLDSAEPEVRKRLVPRAVELAEELPVGSFRRALRRLVELEQSATMAERHEAALQGRRVVVEPAGDGMAWIHALGPEVEAHAIYNRLTAKAKAICAHPDETRTLDQVRADIFGDLLIDGDTAHLAPEARGIRATVTVTVPVLTLLDPEASDSTDAGPAVVEGLGPIPLAKARELAGDADGWTRILTHPETGIVLSVGRDQYRPPPALRRLARWRADRCMAPGCGIPAARCEIDHTIAWEHGGPTALENLAPLCKGHHTIEHHGGWRVEQVPDSGGALHWTSPSGRHYTVQPERRVPVFRASAEPAPAPF
ncbi:HNH endonuclease [Microbacterium sp. Root166]|uniref:HNH endonuclease signature motif containing protein n=1 Tax=Microbacterium sp. Root166 TaxID=1736478 RepID=UPI0006FC3A4F|nr:HNH endonuclease signature motif containing protein [Microbacterium sp. Root166]KQZ83263.1 HNH endonuclease [Microbacterium sp. Root166]